MLCFLQLKQLDSAEKQVFDKDRGNDDDKTTWSLMKFGM